MEQDSLLIHRIVGKHCQEEQHALKFSCSSFFLSTRETSKSQIFQAKKILPNSLFLFWHTLTALPSLDANSSRQNDITWCDFLQGKQVKLPVSRFLCHRKDEKNYELTLCNRENFWARLVGKIIPKEELFYVVLLLGNSVQPQQWWKRENPKRVSFNKQNKSSELPN